jgi:DNA-binding transcriptional regulator YiaG
MAREKISNLTNREFRRKLRAIGMSQRAFAFYVQMDVITVNRWATGVNPVPHWARLLLDLMIEQKRRPS